MPDRMDMTYQAEQIEGVTEPYPAQARLPRW